MDLSVEYRFSAAHSIKIKGEPEPLHGHDFRIRITLSGKPDEDGFIIDFLELEKIVQKLVIDELDHKNLNEIFEQPTVENIGIWIFRRLKEPLKGKNYYLREVRVYETKESWITVRGEDL